MERPNILLKSRVTVGKGEGVKKILFRGAFDGGINSTYLGKAILFHGHFHGGINK